MRMFFCIRNLVKVAAFCLPIILFIKCYITKPAFIGLPRQPLPGVVWLTEYSHQPGSTCSPGFYTQEELKPHFQRPPQDPRAQGANGKAFVSHRLTSDERLENRSGFEKNQFNQFASDRISLHRDLVKDARHPHCLEQKFRRCPGLPTTSVIIVFHNEAWSTLLRTVHSVLHTAPAVLLKEILLVDDASTDDHLKTRLDEYVLQLNIVRVLRQKERKGLITARLMGAQAARGKVLTFLDSHCECLSGWLEPLLARIVEQPTAVVSPKIATIDQNNLKFKMPKQSQLYSRGNFDWGLNFGWEKIPEKERKQRTNETHPIRTPTFAGGLFSVSKSYFKHIGTYDDQMEFWGGENLEMSFRVWQCGGQLEIIPCSIVGHIFRKKTPHKFPKASFMISHNKVRAAEVWMDDYKWVFYRTNKRAADVFKKKLFGDVSERRELRERLKCRDFSWYLNNVYPEGYVPDILSTIQGQLENVGRKCYLDARQINRKWRPIQNFTCSDKGGAHQYFEYTSQKEVRLSAGFGLCLHATPKRAQVSLNFCRLKGKGTRTARGQVWIYTKTNHLKNPYSGKCLATSEGNVIVTACKSSQDDQSWIFVRA